MALVIYKNFILIMPTYLGVQGTEIKHDERDERKNWGTAQGAIRLEKSEFVVSLPLGVSRSYYIGAGLFDARESGYCGSTHFT